VYALAASAAGVGWLALTPLAEAEVVYTPASVFIPYNGVHTYDLDLDGDGITDFTITEFRFSDTDLGFASINVDPASGNGVIGSYKYTTEAVALTRGAIIGSSRKFAPKQARMVEYGVSGGGIYTGGDWRKSNPRFLGLSFRINGETHYGWARLIVKLGQDKLKMTAYLSGYAYETVANQSIRAGSTSGPETESYAAEPSGSLGALAAGAAASPLN
jgi:hypothetical protein